jgi:hypothetical protein
MRFAHPLEIGGLPIRVRHPLDLIRRQSSPLVEHGAFPSRRQGYGIVTSSVIKLLIPGMRK